MTVTAGLAFAADLPRLALLPLDARVRPAADLLTAELSRHDRVTLLERAQIDQVMAATAPCADGFSLPAPTTSW